MSSFRGSISASVGLALVWSIPLSVATEIHLTAVSQWGHFLGDGWNGFLASALGFMICGNKSCGMELIKLKYQIICDPYKQSTPKCRPESWKHIKIQYTYYDFLIYRVNTSLIDIP